MLASIDGHQAHTELCAPAQSFIEGRIMQPAIVAGGIVFNALLELSISHDFEVGGSRGGSLWALHALAYLLEDYA